MRNIEVRVPIRTPEMQRIEARFGRPIEELLQELYHGRGLSDRDVGLELGVTSGAVSRWRERFGIPGRRPGARSKVA